MMMEDDSPKPRVNAAQLQSYLGKNVCLLGIASNVDRSGYSFQLMSSDHQTVVIKLTDPLQELVQGLVEVVGRVSGKNEVTCSNYLQFPDEMSNNFDLDTYNKAVLLMNKFPA